jgi:heme exporter protein C
MINAVVAAIGLAYLLVVGVLWATGRGGRFLSRWEHLVGVYGLALLVTGNVIGLAYAPSERFMGEVGRILYVHVPAAWLAMSCFLLASVAGLLYLLNGRRRWDSLLEAACEVGVLEGMLLLVLGSIFGKPTWGVWWTWDPRLTSSAVMVLSFVGVLLLRSFVLDPDRRATWSSVATVLAGVNLPIVYMSVKWWRGLHQLQSETAEGSAIAPEMRWILYLNTWAFAFVTVWFVARRYRIAKARAEAERPEPLPADLAGGGSPPGVSAHVGT